MNFFFGVLQTVLPTARSRREWSGEASCIHPQLDTDKASSGSRSLFLIISSVERPVFIVNLQRAFRNLLNRRTQSVESGVGMCYMLPTSTAILHKGNGATPSRPHRCSQMSERTFRRSGFTSPALSFRMLLIPSQIRASFVFNKTASRSLATQELRMYDSTACNMVSIQHAVGSDRCALSSHQMLHPPIARH